MGGITTFLGIIVASTKKNYRPHAQAADNVTVSLI